jgi:ion channel
LFLLLFASAYVVMGAVSASNFSRTMTHTNALYFTVTVFASVGFGDITPKTGVAPAGGHRADDCRSHDHRARGQDHPGCGYPRPSAAAALGYRPDCRQLLAAGRRNSRPCDTLSLCRVCLTQETMGL